MKLLKVQKALFIDESKELTKAEYDRLVQEAQRKNNERLALVIQTICATSIRVSELRFITVESVQNGRVEISSKGKRRMVFLPDKLRQRLRNYVRKQKKTAGVVVRPVKYLARYEGPVRKCWGSAREGLSP